MPHMNPVLDYHERSKHHLNRYAPGPDGLDWTSQPNPSAAIPGAPELELPLLAGELPLLTTNCSSVPVCHNWS